VTSCDDFQVPDCRSSICCAPCRWRVDTQKTRSRRSGDVALTVFRRLGEELKRPGASPRGAAEMGAAASNKRTLDENCAAHKLSRVMFSAKRRLALNSLCLLGAVCSMRVTSAAQLRVIGKIRQVTSLDAVNLRGEAV
jgi:hypothetical protein